MTNAIPILTIVAFRDPAAGSALAEQVTVHGVGSGVLRIDPALDDVVSHLVQAKLAELSPTFAAELAATTHFVEALDKLTVTATKTARVPDDISQLEPKQETCSICNHPIEKSPPGAPGLGWKHYTLGGSHDPHWATPA